MAGPATDHARHFDPGIDHGRRAGVILDQCCDLAMGYSCFSCVVGNRARRRRRAGGLVFAPEALAFKPEKLSPANKVKQMFSLAGLSGILKSLIPFGVIAWIGVSTVQRIGKA